MAASKLAAGRPKDWPFVEAMLRYQIIQPETLRSRIDLLPVADEARSRLRCWLDGYAKRAMRSAEGDNVSPST